MSALKGSASQYLCSYGNQAEQWAYSHADHDQACMSIGKDRGKPYSTHPDHYQASMPVLPCGR